MPEMFQTLFWDQLLEKYATDIAQGQAYHLVPFDIQVKVPFDQLIKTPEDVTIGVWGEADLPELDCECFFGAIIQAENDRFFALELDDEGDPMDDLSEVDVDNSDLAETHVIMYDNAENGNGGDCPNPYKNKKPWKELNAPVKILCHDDNTRDIIYTIKVNIYYPTDPNGNQQPPLNYQWTHKDVGQAAIQPYADIVMPALVFMKPACVHAPPTPATICPTSPALLLR
jgi:hypothetical protein